MTYDRQLAHRLRRYLARRGDVQEKRLSCGVGFLMDGHLCAGVWNDSLIARVGPDAYRSALAEPFARELVVKGRLMKGWVLLQPAAVEDELELLAWLGRVMQHNRSLSGHRASPDRRPRSRRSSDRS